MTYEQGFVLLVTAAAAVAFVSERVRSEVVALCVLCALALSGVVSPSEALSGFSSEAVVTVAPRFFGYFGSVDRDRHPGDGRDIEARAAR